MPNRSLLSDTNLPGSKRVKKKRRAYSNSWSRIAEEPEKEATDSAGPGDGEHGGSSPFYNALLVCSWLAEPNEKENKAVSHMKSPETPKYTNVAITQWMKKQTKTY